jgi:hypothetical protein
MFNDRIEFIRTERGIVYAPNQFQKSNEEIQAIIKRAAED